MTNASHEASTAPVPAGSDIAGPLEPLVVSAKLLSADGAGFGSSVTLMIALVLPAGMVAVPDTGV